MAQETQSLHENLEQIKEMDTRTAVETQRKADAIFRHEYFKRALPRIADVSLADSIDFLRDVYALEQAPAEWQPGLYQQIRQKYFSTESPINISAASRKKIIKNPANQVEALQSAKKEIAFLIFQDNKTAFSNLEKQLEKQIAEDEKNLPISVAHLEKAKSADEKFKVISSSPILMQRFFEFDSKKLIKENIEFLEAIADFEKNPTVGNFDKICIMLKGENINVMSTNKNKIEDARKSLPAVGVDEILTEDQKKNCLDALSPAKSEVNKMLAMAGMGDSYYGQFYKFLLPQPPKSKKYPVSAAKSTDTKTAPMQTTAEKTAAKQGWFSAIAKVADYFLSSFIKNAVKSVSSVIVNFFGKKTVYKKTKASQTQTAASENKKDITSAQIKANENAIAANLLIKLELLIKDITKNNDPKRQSKAYSSLLEQKGTLKNSPKELETKFAELAEIVIARYPSGSAFQKPLEAAQAAISDKTFSAEVASTSEAPTSGISIKAH